MSIGIPQLLVPTVESIGESALTLAQGAIWDYLTADTKWGVYYAGSTQQVILGNNKPSGISGILGQATSINGAKALLNGELISNNIYIDSVVSISQTKSSEISEYKIETGSFVSFNKIEKPREITIQLTKGGTEEERGFFLSWLESQVKYLPSGTQVGTIRRIGSLSNLFDIYVPEVNYQNMTLIDYSITREATSGVNLIIADCVFKEVRQVTASYTNSKTQNAQNASDIPSTQTNSVVTNTPSPNALSKIKGVLGI